MSAYPPCGTLEGYQRGCPCGLCAVWRDWWDERPILDALAAYRAEPSFERWVSANIAMSDTIRRIPWTVFDRDCGNRRANRSHVSERSGFLELVAMEGGATHSTIVRYDEYGSKRRNRRAADWLTAMGWVQRTHEQPDRALFRIDVERLGRDPAASDPAAKRSFGWLDYVTLLLLIPALTVGWWMGDDPTPGVLAAAAILWAAVIPLVIITIGKRAAPP